MPLESKLSLFFFFTAKYYYNYRYEQKVVNVSKNSSVTIYFPILVVRFMLRLASECSCEQPELVLSHASVFVAVPLEHP